MKFDVRIPVVLGVVVLGASTSHADCPVSLDGAYTYADETGTKVALDGSAPVHVQGQLVAQGEVYAGVGVGLAGSDAPLDATTFRGIAFRAKRGPGGSTHVRVKIPDGNTDPRGGVCTECFNDFGLTFQVTEEWVRYEVPFEQLKQEGGWGKPNPPSIDKAKLYGVQWQTTTPGAVLDLYIDSVEILGCETPTTASVSADATASAPRGLGGDNRPRNSAGESTNGYSLSFHGYLRLPLRVGIGSGGSFGPGVDNGRKLHSPPQIPDGAYTDWRYTNVSGGPWTEVWLQYGNGTVAANIVLAAYDITDASYRDLLSQLGINQAFVSFDLPRLFGESGGVAWNVGAFSNRYGMAGQYDAGKYDTYLFGATHVAGETVSAFYRLTPELTLLVDHGIGAKLQVAPQVPGLEAPYLPYPGELQQGSTFLHHGHVGLGIGKNLTVAAHVLTSWTDDSRLSDEQDGRITNVGVDVKLVESKLGDGYLGVSRIISDNPLRVAGAFEALHSFEGWNLRDNYFGETATGTGTIDTVYAQHVFSLERFRRGVEDFWGQGPDVVLAGFAMYNRVRSDDAAFTGARGKLKLGGEATWTPRKWFGVDFRYDLVRPDTSDSRQTFHVLSPSIILRTSFASNEQVTIGYSRYVNGDRVAPGYPHESLAPDKHLLRLSASMWW
ncbi:MAG TPA: hypothetical protein VIV11_17470 [Kofleriaceae bacterium]